ncbi:hypothetical protein KY290_001828 [Solanum tuberosum]|uniref:Uncharacterized protein n=1 Tax=Solanum tuberosum TaxID=4113 RepID=A0ABQ7WND0_SOLTU|nr:hypothetical protein KY290_001828 [Solanum tuberosum]
MVDQGNWTFAGRSDGPWSPIPWVVPLRGLLPCSGEGYWWHIGMQWMFAMEFLVEMSTAGSSIIGNRKMESNPVIGRIL